MATLAEILGEKLATGMISVVIPKSALEVPDKFDVGKFTGTVVAEDVRRIAATKDERTAIDIFLKMHTGLTDQGVSFMDNPITLAILAFVAMPFIIGQGGSILNEVTLLRGLRKSVRPVMLSAMEIIQSWRREDITPDIMRGKLAEVGISETDIDSLLKITEFVPGPQDIIRFAVREVYNPDARRELDLDAEVEPVLQAGAKDMRAIGMPESVMRDFWAAHWVLPSVGQAFEMRHRGIIDAPGLTGLLKALDIAPVWRDRLEGIAFSPFTRVDIRRMHKLGVLSDDDVIRAYKDIGYDDEKAQMQLEFVRKLNGDPSRDEETFSDREALRARDLSRGDVLEAFEDGVIERKIAMIALESLGFAPGEVEHLLDRTEFKAAVSASKRAIRNLQKSFVSGAVAENFVRGIMGELDLPAKYVDDQISNWKLEAETNVSLPTKAEILRWFGNDLLDEPEARDALTRMGFAPKWVDLYIREKAPVDEVPE